MSVVTVTVEDSFCVCSPGDLLSRRAFSNFQLGIIHLKSMHLLLLKDSRQALLWRTTARNFFFLVLVRTLFGGGAKFGKLRDEACKVALLLWSTLIRATTTTFDLLFLTAHLCFQILHFSLFLASRNFYLGDTFLVHISECS